MLEWQAFYELEPWGPVQEDLRAGIIASLFYNANRGKNKKPLHPEDFFPSLKHKRKAQSPDDIRQALIGWVAALGGEFRKAGE